LTIGCSCQAHGADQGIQLYLKPKQMNPKVDDFLGKAERWRKELEILREIIVACGLVEELKWGVPCYTFQQTNLIAINGLKDSCVLSFFSGALLSDDHRILIKPGANTQVGRWIKFTSVQEIIDMGPILKAYIYESIEVQRAGVKAFRKKNPEPIPAELQKRFKDLPGLKKAFHELTPGRQRAYILYFSAPKQSKTRESRIEKCLQQILNGQGLNDNYHRLKK
jgi:uncharacterized protein YdeI (YjbR/CyaY-like superfamily)